ncbi:hypothetical protein LZ30DRAFT_357916 [Colletotrichum cereale]|nr:hypothetical protein LZ30DRAFT_357916 [Colletotrichum cereale]
MSQKQTPGTSENMLMNASPFSLHPKKRARFPTTTRISTPFLPDHSYPTRPSHIPASIDSGYRPEILSPTPYRHHTKKKGTMTEKTSADELYAELVRDRFPNDPDAVADYGFDRCRSVSETRSLLEVYKTVMIRGRVSPATLDGWRRQGRGALGAHVRDALQRKAYAIDRRHIFWF